MKNWLISKKLNGKIEIHQLTISHNNHNIDIEIAVNIEKPEQETLISAILDEKLTLVFTYIRNVTSIEELRSIAICKTSDALQDLEQLCDALWSQTKKIHHEQVLQNLCKPVTRDDIAANTLETITIAEAIGPKRIHKRKRKPRLRRSRY